MTSFSSYDNFPALEPPPGVEPNYWVNTYSKGYVLINVNTVFFAVMVTFIGIRFYSRIFIIKKLFPDDITCLLAALGVTGYYTASIIGVVDGPVGKHQWDVTVGEVTSKIFIVDVAYIGVVLLSPTLLATKLTFLLSYLYVFKPFRWMRICCYFGIVFTAAFYIASWIVQVYLATPKAGQTWTIHVQSAEELTMQHISVVFSSVGLGIDVYLLILPIGAVSRLQLPWQRKLGVSLLFLTGFFACISSALSIYFRAVDNRTGDTTWATQNVVIAGFLEPVIGVSVSCMPATAKVFSHHISYKSLASLFSTSWFSSKRFTNSRSKSRSQSNTNNLPFHVIPSKSSLPIIKPTSAQNDASSSLKSYMDKENKQPLSYELNHLNSISTFIRASNKNQLSADDDRIYLKREIWQANK